MPKQYYWYETIFFKYYCLYDVGTCISLNIKDCCYIFRSQRFSACSSSFHVDKTVSVTLQPPSADQCTNSLSDVALITFTANDRQVWTNSLATSVPILLQDGVLMQVVGWTVTRQLNNIMWLSWLSYLSNAAPTQCRFLWVLPYFKFHFFHICQSLAV